MSGGNFHAEPVAFAADMIALAICEIGSLAERRVAMLIDPALSGLPAFLTPRPGLNSGFMLPQVTAAALVSENKILAHPASVDSITTSGNKEDYVSMGMSGAPISTAQRSTCKNCDQPEISIPPTPLSMLATVDGSGKVTTITDPEGRYVVGLQKDL